CSSFQLEDTHLFRPEVGVLLNLTPDHLDRHRTLEGYLDAKLRVFANQGADDVAGFDLDERRRLGFDVPGSGEAMPYGTSACSEEGDGCAVWAAGGAIHSRTGRVIGIAELALAGGHNLRNAMAVVSAAIALGLDPSRIAPGLRDFGGVPHRLELVVTREGVSFVNDSKATNVAAAEAAIRSFEGGVRLICGGSLKGGGFGELRGVAAERVAAAYLIGEAASALRVDLAGATALHECGSLERAVAKAAAEAEPGETVLLAPACASFDAFRDYEHRGERFRELVEELR
ncbi:MAG: UDP-N-acetylmuramoyl-L-alanine--D-glutamate ligase, partial [Solirubrobacterales bacterium]